MKIQVHTFTFNGFQENTYLLSDEDKNCVIIDAGCYSREEQMELMDYVEDNGFVPLALLNTHAHIDHVLGNAFLHRAFGLKSYLHPLDIPTLEAVSSYAHLYGFEGYVPAPAPDVLLNEGDKLVFGGIELEVIFTPGHAPGHVVFYNAENGFVINGDVLFSGSFGRVDLPGGDLDTLKASIFEKMFVLPEETMVYCGHGPETTIGKEKRTNYIYNF